MVIRCGSPAKSGNEPKAHGQILTGEAAGCEALRAEQPVDGIRSALLPGAKRPATTWLFSGRDFFALRCKSMVRQYWTY